MQHYTCVKNLKKTITLFLRHPFRCLEADALFVFNEIFFFKHWVSCEALITLSLP